MQGKFTQECEKKIAWNFERNNKKNLFVNTFNLHIKYVIVFPIKESEI